MWRPLKSSHSITKKQPRPRVTGSYLWKERLAPEKCHRAAGAATAKQEALAPSGSTRVVLANGQPDPLQDRGWRWVPHFLVGDCTPIQSMFVCTGRENVWFSQTLHACWKFYKSHLRDFQLELQLHSSFVVFKSLFEHCIKET